MTEQQESSMQDRKRAERETTPGAGFNSERFASLIEVMTLGVVYQDVSGAITYANPAAQKILGLSLDEMQGRKSVDPRWRAIHEDGRDFPGETHPAMVALRTGQVVENVVMGVFHPKASQYVWILINSVPEFRSGEDRPYQVFTTFNDITALKAAQEENRESQATFQEYFNSGVAGMATTGPDGKWISINDRFCEMLGYTRDEMVQRSWVDLTHPDDVEKNMILFRKLTAGETDRYQINKRYLRKDGQPLHVNLSVSCSRGPDGSVKHLFSTVVDISEQMRFAEALRQANERYRLIAENTFDVIWVMDLDAQKFTYVSPSVERLRGYTPEEVMQQPIGDALTPESNEIVRRILAETIPMVMAGKTLPPAVVELDQPCKDGSIVPTEVTTNLILKDGRLQVVGISRDISERKKANELIVKTQSSLELAQSVARMGSWELDPASGQGTWSKEMFRLFQMDPATGTADVYALVEKIHPDDRAALLALQQRVLKDGQPAGNIFRAYPAPGNERIFEITFYPIVDSASGTVRITGTVFDITERHRAQDQLRQEKEKLENIAETIPGVIFMMHILSDGRQYLSYVSPKVKDLYGLEAEELYNSLAPAAKFAPKEDLQRFNQALQNSAKTLRPFKIEMRFDHAEKGLLWVEIYSTPVREPDGNFVFYGIITDVSDRKQAELEISQHMDDLTLINTLNDAINRGESLKEITHLMHAKVKEKFAVEAIGLYLVNEDRKHISTVSFNINREVEQWIKKVTGREIPVVKVPMTRGSAFSRLLEQKQGTIESGIETLTGQVLEIVEADVTSETMKAVLRKLLPQVGKLLNSRSMISIPLILNGQPLGLLQFTSGKLFSQRDLERLERISGQLTAAIIRKQGEDKLRLVNERFEQLAGNIEEIFWVVNHNAESTEQVGEYFSPAFDKIFGLDREALAKNLQLYNERIHPEDAALMRQAQADEKAGIPTELEYRYLHPDGSIRWIWERSSPVKDEEGGVLRTVGVSSDITANKQVELKTKERESFLQSVVTSSPGDILVINLDGFYMYSSRRWKEQPDEVFHSTRFVDQVHPTHAELAESLIRLAIEQKQIQRAELQVIAETGEYHWWEVVFSPVIVDEQVDRVTLFTYDINERKRAELALAASEEKYRLLTEELEQRVKERTAEVQDLYERAPTGYHSIDGEGVFRMINQTELNWLGYAREEVIGRRFSDFITANSLELFRNSLPKFVEQGWMRDLEFEFVRKDGSTFPVLLGATAIYDKDGSFVMSRSTVFDNTERKKAENALRESEQSLRKSRDQLSAANAALEKASRLKDEFLASMSHELRTPLTGILGLSEVLQMQTYGALSEKQLRALRQIEESGRHLLELINDILDLSKIEADKLELNIESCSVSDICQASLQLTKGMAHQKRQMVSFTTSPASAVVQADPRRFKQMLVNLLSNAVKFTPEGGTLGLEVVGDEQDQMIHLTVWDKGIGIKAEDIGKLFKPFTQLDSSLARQHSGTGLGLSLVAKLAQLHGGSVKVESTFGEGSRFTLSLPWQVEGSPKPEPEEGMNIRIRRCLLIEDNPLHRKQIGDYLRRLNIETIYQAQGSGSLNAAMQARPDVILLDLNLPDISGEDVLLELKSHPLTRDMIIIISSVSEERKKYLELGAAGYLVKPFNLDDLRREFLRVEANASQKRDETENLRSKGVLLVADDDEIILDTLTDFLQSKGYHVVKARSGKELLELAPVTNVDMILTDIQMPGMDGVQAIKQIRGSGNPHLQKVPIVAVTALAMPGDEEMCLNAGANKYISKPVPLTRLVRMIEELIAAE